MDTIAEKMEKIYFVFNEAIECGNKIVYLEDEKNRIEKEKERIEEKATDTNIFTWIVIFGTPIVGLLLTGSLIVFFLGFILGFILYMILWYIIDKVTKRSEKMEKSAEFYYSEHMPSIIEEESEMLTRLHEIQKSSEWLEMEKIIPKDYQNIQALECIVKYIKNHRAETLKEAFNLYEDESHKLKTLHMQEEQIELVNRSLEKQTEHIALSEEILSEQKRQGRVQKKQLNHARFQTVANAVQLYQLHNLNKNNKKS